MAAFAPKLIVRSLRRRSVTTTQGDGDYGDPV